MNIGTRVTHRRYGWMVGYVTGVPTLGVRTVIWEYHHCDRDEYESDLLPTPIQLDLTCPCRECTCGLPTVRYHHGDGDEDLPVND